PGKIARGFASHADRRGLARAADLVLSGRRGVAARGCRMGPLSKAVDQLMDTSRLALELTHPVRLVCLAGVPVLLYYFYRSLVDFPRWQRRLSLAVRTVIVTLLVLALAGLTLLRPTSEQFVVFAVDRSISIGEESTQAADRFLDEALTKAGSHKFAILPFA